MTRPPSCHNAPRLAMPYPGLERVYLDNGKYYLRQIDIVSKWDDDGGCQIAKEPLAECGGCCHIKE